LVQARRFGAELLLARPLTGVPADGSGYAAELSDGTLIRGRAVLFASGVEWRRLDVPGIDDLLGAGVYYGAGPSEALACTDSQVVVVGGGNSAGPGGRPVLPVRPAGHAAGPRPRPRRIDVAVPH